METSCRKSRIASSWVRKGFFLFASFSSITLAVLSAGQVRTGSGVDFSWSRASGSRVPVLLRDTSSMPSQKAGSWLCEDLLGFVEMQTSLILFS